MTVNFLPLQLSDLSSITNIEHSYFFYGCLKVFCLNAFKDSTDGQYLWGCGSISPESILVFPKDVVYFGFYAVS